jgi:hypothetical protein
MDSINLILKNRSISMSYIYNEEKKTSLSSPELLSMASVTLTRRAHNLNFIREHRNNQAYNTDDEDINESNHHYCSTMKKPIETFSCEQTEVQSTKKTNNRFRHLCSRFKRRLTLTKEHRTCSEETTGNISEHRFVHLGNYKSFSSTVDESSNDIEWPDFEKVYDSIPSCLLNALPGRDDFSVDKKHYNSLNLSNFQTDQSSIEKMDLFLQCKRGNNFRRNGICLKLDKTQYHGQLDIFIQQLMVEKLLRTWT